MLLPNISLFYFSLTKSIETLGERMREKGSWVENEREKDDTYKILKPSPLPCLNVMLYIIRTSFCVLKLLIIF